MTNSKKINAGAVVALLLMVVSVQPAAAQCYDFSGDPPTLGAYLACAVPGLFGVFQMATVAIALILGMVLVLKIAMNRENPEFLSELPNKVMYLIILGFLAAGFGGTLVNIVLRFLGFGEIQTWLDVINNFLAKMDEWVTD